MQLYGPDSPHRALHEAVMPTAFIVGYVRDRDRLQDQDEFTSDRNEECSSDKSNPEPTIDGKDNDNQIDKKENKSQKSFSVANWFFGGQSKK